MRALTLATLVAALGCGSGTPGSSQCNYDRCDSGVENSEDTGRSSDGNSGNANRDGNKNSDSCSPCGYDMDNSDSRNDLGNSDLENRLDSGTPDVGVDSAVTYPIAALNCTERNDDGLCVFRMRRGISHYWDASPSQAGPGRNIEWYKLYLPLPGDKEEFWIRSNIPIIGGGYDVTNSEYGLPDGFPAELEVTDDLGAIGRVGLRNIVTD